MVPSETPEGFAVGPPNTPKSAPVPVEQVPSSAGPAFERSIAPPAAKAVVELELTWMLLLGPPQI